MPIDRNLIITRSSTPVETTVGTEVVLMSLASGLCFGLGDTGSEIWRLLAQPNSIAGVTARLLTMYAAPAEVIEADVAEMVDKMLELNLVSVSP